MRPLFSEDAFLLADDGHRPSEAFPSDPVDELGEFPDTAGIFSAEIVYPADGRGQGLIIGPHHIIHVDEVARLSPGSADQDFLIVQQSPAEAFNHGLLRHPAFSVDIGLPKDHGLQVPPGLFVEEQLLRPLLELSVEVSGIYRRLLGDRRRTGIIDGERGREDDFFSSCVDGFADQIFEGEQVDQDRVPCLGFALGDVAA